MHAVTQGGAGATTTLRLRVRFCDTDLMGIVHHANYLAYFEAGRVEWLRRRGVTYASWAQRGICPKLKLQPRRCERKLQPTVEASS